MKPLANILLSLLFFFSAGFISFNFLGLCLNDGQLLITEPCEWLRWLELALSISVTAFAFTYMVYIYRRLWRREVKGIFTLVYDPESKTASHMTNIQLELVQQLLQQIIIDEGVRNATELKAKEPAGGSPGADN